MVFYQLGTTLNHEIIAHLIKQMETCSLEHRDQSVQDHEEYYDILNNPKFYLKYKEIFENNYSPDEAHKSSIKYKLDYEFSKEIKNEP